MKTPLSDKPWTPEDMAYRPSGLPQDFIKHEVESAEDWSEWVCPDPNEYLIKCCDCGLVHEAQFRVAEYKPTPSEEFVVTNNPDMQTQFRMKRHNIKGASL